MGSYDVCVVGGGPAGAACALQLSALGRSVMLVEKATFPRDKACGDAIPWLTFKALKDVLPEAEAEASALPSARSIPYGRVISPRGYSTQVKFSRPGLAIKRAEFDAWLFEKARWANGVESLTDEVASITGKPGKWEIQTKGGQALKAAALVGADGAYSLVRRSLMPDALKPLQSAAVRAYMDGASASPGQPAELQLGFPRQILPGYGWVFPLSAPVFNVGIGVLLEGNSGSTAQPLKRLLFDMLSKGKFSKGVRLDASTISAYKGHLLPLGKEGQPLSGAGFVLCGDAGALISPATGEGIGNAVLSGVLAAKTLHAALAEGDLTRKCLSAYDKAVYSDLGPTFSRQIQAVRLFSARPWLLDAAVLAAKALPPLKRYLAGL